jgi:hypothetical protein
MADLTLRLIKGSPVTFAEMDSNLLALDSDSPWKVSDGHITYQGKVGIGYGVDSNYRPTYQLDFGYGDSNQQVSVGTFADLGLHLDNSSTFTVYNDGTEKFLIDEEGRVGIGITVPNQPLDVLGNIQSTATVIGNQGFFQSVYDGTMTISGGTIFNGNNAFMSGTVQFGQLSDQTNTVVGFEIDELSGSSIILPASSAIKFSLDSEVAVLNASIDSDHAWANTYIDNVDSDARARDDSDRADLINQIDSDHAWANTYINNVDSDARARDDSEHAWALSQFGSLDSALDSEHAWNIAEHTTLQNNIDSEHQYALGQSNLLNARADSEHAWANNNFDSEHAWNVASHNQLQANIDSDHLWAVRNFDSDHAWAVNNFDSEHFWAKAYVEAGDSVVDSELQKQIRIQNALNDSEHAWNVAEHAALQQDIDSEHSFNVAQHAALESRVDSRIDSDHAWANTYISNVDSNSRARDDSDHSWANNFFTQIQNRLDSEHTYAVAELDSEHQRMLRDVDSDHQWAVVNFAAITDANDSEHAWNVAEHAKLDSNIDSLQRFVLRIDSDNDADRAARFDSEHAWNVAEHTQLRSEIDSDHAWAVSQFDSTWQAIRNIDSDNDADRGQRFDSEHAWNVQEHNTLRAEIDSDHAWAVSNFDSEHTYNVTQHANLQSNIDSNLTRIESLDSNLDSEHAWNVAEHTQLRSEIDSDHAWAVSQFDSTWTAIKAIDSANDSDRAKRLDSEHAWNIAEHAKLESDLDSLQNYVNTFVAVEIAKLDSNLDSEHAWNVQEHQALEDSLNTLIQNFNAFTGGQDSSYTSKHFDSDFTRSSTDSLSEGTNNLYYTTARADSDAKHAVSAGNGLDYDSSTGRFRTDSQADVVFNDLILTGDLTVQGGQTIINTENLNVSDTRITLNDSSPATNVNDIGFIFERGNDSSATFFWDESEDKFTLGVTSDSGRVNGDIGVTVGTLVANIEGNVTGQVSDISNHTTDQLAEGATNLYYTQARAQTDFDSGLATKTTDDVAEGTTNLYYTQARAQTDFDSGLATKTTTDVAEGTNLYYTTARADSDAKHALTATGPVVYDENTGTISMPAGNLGVLTINGVAFDPVADSDMAINVAVGNALQNTDSLAEGSVNLYYTQARAQTDFDSGLATKTTDDLTEGTTNLYYTQARAQTDFDSGLATKSTTDLAEGTNLYYTNARWDSDLDSAIAAGKIAAGRALNNTDSLAEGSVNLYYTQTRAQTDFDSGLATKTTDDLTEGTTNLYYTQIRAQTDFDSGLATKSTTDLAEGTNLYYTNARWDSDLDSAIAAAAPVTYNSTTGDITIPSGNLGILTINGVAFDPVADSDRSFTLAAGSALTTTDSLPEGSVNLYYTQTRAQTDFDSGLATKTTDDVAEGTNNLYYTQSRAQTDFDSGLATKSTTDLAEGTNLYYTNARWDSDLDSAIAAGKIAAGRALNNTDSLAEGSVNLYYTQARAQTDFDSGMATKTTTDLAEGTNLYYTTARADSDAKNALTATAPVAYDASTGTISIPAGNLGVLSLNGQAFDPLADSDKAFTFAARALVNTDSLAEGPTNLYYTKDRWDSALDSAITAGKIATENYNSTDSLPEGTTNLYYTNARFDSDLDSAIQAGKISLWDSAKTVGVVDSYVDSDFVQLHQRFMHLVATAPSPVQVGELWLDIDDSSAGVRIWDGSVWFELPTPAANLASNTTDELPEGTTNLYYTRDRFDSAFALATTDSLSEGTTNLYYTQARAQADFDSGLASKTTDDVAEGTTNFYYTNARFDSDLDSALQAGKFDFWDSAKSVGVIDSYVDSDFVAQHQRFLHLETTAPTGVREGELWLDIDDSSAGVRIWDGTVWFELPTPNANLASNTTDDLPEGTTNLYYSRAKFDSDLLASNRDFLDSAEAIDLLANKGTEGHIPLLDSTYDLGSPTRKWKDLYLSGNTIYLGGVQISAQSDSGGGLAVDNKLLRTHAVTDLKDEDNMVSNSTTQAPTQSSAKAYVDNSLSALLLDEDTFVSNSATQAPSQQSTKAYVDNAVSAISGLTISNFDPATIQIGSETFSDDDTHLMTAAAIKDLVDANGGLWTLSGSDATYTAGNVGIGTTSPLAKLHVAGETYGGTATSTSGSRLLSNQYSGSNRVNVLSTHRSSSAWCLGFAVEASTTADATFVSTAGNAAFAKGALHVDNELRFFSGSAATVAIGSSVTMTERMRLSSAGELHCDGDIVAFSTTVSDRKFKDQIETIDNALDKVKALRGVEYTWNTSARKGERDMGLIAQEVEAVIPNVVREKKLVVGEWADNPTTAKTVDYEKLTAVLIEAVKEQQEQINELKKLVEDKS